MYKQWIQKLGDFLLIRKVQCAVKRYPAGPRVSLNEGEKICIYPHKGTATYHTPLRCIGPIFTTCRTFSLFKIPSRLPRVIPATFNSLVPLIMWLSYKIQSLVSQKHKWGRMCVYKPSRRATHTPFASTWKHKLPSSSHSVAVTLGFIPGGAC